MLRRGSSSFHRNLPQWSPNYHGGRRKSRFHILIQLIMFAAFISAGGMFFLMIYRKPDFEMSAERPILPESQIKGTLLPPKSPPNPAVAKIAEVRSQKESLSKVVVVLVCYNRPEYLKLTLNSLTTLWPQGDTISNAHFSLIISQDGEDVGVTNVIEKLKQRFHVSDHLRFNYESALWQSRYREPFNEQLAVYYRISAHYHFILSNFLKSNLNYSHVLFVEDDMMFAPDFFHYFAAASPYLRSYKSVFCVSAWNDNGQEDFVYDPGVLLRTEVFPGLGWMMTREIASELIGKWPAGFWDDWLREPGQRNGRSCIFPEISRVKTFGSEGSSKGEWFDQYLAKIQLNENYVDWTRQPGKMKVVFDEAMFREALWREVNASNPISIENLPRIWGDVHTGHNRTFRLDYRTEAEFKMIADIIKCMPDWKSGLPRGSYQGISVFRIHKARLFLVKTLRSSA